MITLFLIAATSLFSIAALSNRTMLSKYSFIPSVITGPGHWYRFITHGFIHADLPHLIMNMVVLFSFGPVVEKTIEEVCGADGVFIFYPLLYILGMVAASVPGYFRHRSNFGYSAVGASGAIASVLFFSIMFYPLGDIGILFLPFKIAAFIFGILYLVYEYIMDKRANGRIAHDAHFWGAIFGVFYALVIYPPVAGIFVDQIVSWASTVL